VAISAMTLMFLSLEVQAKLLCALQEKEFERVGGSQIIKSDGRILATTNKTLEKAVEILERDRIVDSLKMMRGNMAKSANTLGITERQIAYKAKKGGVARRLQYSNCFRL